MGSEMCIRDRRCIVDRAESQGQEGAKARGCIGVTSLLGFVGILDLTSLVSSPSYCLGVGCSVRQLHSEVAIRMFAVDNCAR